MTQKLLFPLDRQVRLSPWDPVPTQGSHSGGVEMMVWHLQAGRELETAVSSSSPPVNGVERIVIIPMAFPMFYSKKKLKVLALCLPKWCVNTPPWGCGKNWERSQILSCLEANKLDSHCFIDTGGKPDFWDRAEGQFPSHSNCSNLNFSISRAGSPSPSRTEQHKEYLMTPAHS